MRNPSKLKMVATGLSQLLVHFTLLFLVGCGGSGGSDSTSTNPSDVTAPSLPSDVTAPSLPSDVTAPPPPSDVTPPPPPSPPPPPPPTIESPVRMTQSPNGELIVSEFTQGKVLFLDPETLEVVSHINVRGRLSGVAVTADIIFVGDENSGSVGAYNQKGELLYKLGSGDGEFVKPNDMVINEANDEIYVVDTLAHVVKVYRLNGTLLDSDFGYGKLNYPTGITIDRDSGTVLISDFAAGSGSNGCSGGLCFDTDKFLAGIWRYSLNGNFIGLIQGDFSRPQGLAVAKGLIYVTDSLLGQVIVYQLDPITSAYVEYERYGGDGVAGVLMRLPLDPVVDTKRNILFVTVNSSGRIEVFGAGGGV